MKILQLELVAYLFSCFHFVLCLPLNRKTVSNLISEDKVIKECKNRIFLDLADKECNFEIEGEKLSYEQLRCLMLYDVNKRLCKNNNVTIQTQTLETIYKQPVTATQLCSAPIAVSEDLTGFPAYSKSMTKILNNSRLCSSLCTEDISDDAYMACRLLFHITDILKDAAILSTQPKTNPSSTAEPNASADSVNNLIKPEEDPKPQDETQLNSLPIIGNQTETQIVNQPAQEPAQEPEGPVVVVGNPVDSAKQHEINVKSDQNIDKHIVLQSNKSQKESNKIIKPVEETPAKAAVEKLPEVALNPDEPVNDGNQIDTPGKDDESGNADDLEENENSEYDLPSLDNNKLNSKDHTQTKALTESNTKIEKETDKSNGKKTETSEGNVFPFQNEEQEGYITVTRDDSSFFQFFLTVVGVGGLLYIIYHQKNKISKLIMGLLLEGRQSGSRRRNSRGHAYKRLDTLEQAMGQSAPSTSHSKVIY